MNIHPKGLPLLTIILLVSLISLIGYKAFKPTRAPSPAPAALSDYSAADWNSTDSAEAATSSAEGSRCGGTEKISCPEGYLCLTAQSVPTADGLCTKAVCPQTKVITCMPGEGSLDVGIYCTPRFSEWIQDNCPGASVVY